MTLEERREICERGLVVIKEVEYNGGLLVLLGTTNGSPSELHREDSELYYEIGGMPRDEDSED